MALDGIFLYSIVYELKNKILNSRVDKITQPEKDEIVLNLRSDRVNYRLLLSASSVYPKLHLTDVNKVNPLTPPMFCMVLRKYLTGAKLIKISQVGADRIVIIDFESTDELGFNSVYSLVIEIMGRHSNITLIRERDRIVVDSIKHITPDINSYRSLYPGIKYIFPPESKKLSPFDFSKEELHEYINTNFIEFDKSLFSKTFSGVSTQFSKEMYYRLSSRNIAVAAENISEIYLNVHSTFSKLKNYDFHFASYIDNNIVKEFYCDKLESLNNLGEEIYDSPSKLLEDYYYKKDKADRLTAKSADLHKIITTNIDRCSKKILLLKNVIEEAKDKDQLKLYGELLTSSIYNIKKGDKVANILNYYSEDGEYIDIPLDENKTPSENIQSYFKKYSKHKKSEEMAILQLKSAEEEMDYLQSVITNIKNVENYNEIEEIRRELVDTGYIKFKKENKKKIQTSKPMHFVSSDGLDIYIGKNNIQNDYLTLKFAEKQDIWLHAKNIPGSHVIIKHTKILPERTLEEAAILAAYYSKSKDDSKVPVDYTEVKNVKKPSGAKPGMVIYYTNKTIYVTPEELNLKRIQ